MTGMRETVRRLRRTSGEPACSAAKSPFGRARRAWYPGCSLLGSGLMGRFLPLLIVSGLLLAAPRAARAGSAPADDAALAQRARQMLQLERIRANATDDATRRAADRRLDALDRSARDLARSELSHDLGPASAPGVERVERFETNVDAGRDVRVFSGKQVERNARTPNDLRDASNSGHAGAVGADRAHDASTGRERPRAEEIRHDARDGVDHDGDEHGDDRDAGDGGGCGSSGGGDGSGDEGGSGPN